MLVVDDHAFMRDAITVLLTTAPGTLPPCGVRGAGSIRESSTGGGDPPVMRSCRYR